jgi:hypothetical protein
VIHFLASDSRWCICKKWLTSTDQFTILFLGRT